MNEDLPMVVKNRDSLPALYRHTYYPELPDYYSVGSGEDFSSGNTTVASLAQVAGLRVSQSLADGYISSEELDALEGRSIFDRPIVVHSIAFLVAMVTIAILCWAIFEL